jgi:hypothetical protein
MSLAVITVYHSKKTPGPVKWLKNLFGKFSSDSFVLYNFLLKG